MRTLLLLLSTLMAGAVAAQCDFDPVITPDPVENLCPDEEVTIMTDEYESYQWYRDGEIIPGATEQTLTVTYFDSGVPFTVEVTHEGCTEMSPEVWVDGWNWLPPFVIHGGDEPIATGPNGESIHCEGDVLELEMSMGFTNVVWTNNGVPIPGETNNLLIVTEDGSYSATASPLTCPDFVSNLGVTIDVSFIEPQQPSIMENDDELCAFPLGTSYTWYLNGEELIGDTTACIIDELPGAYTVFVEYGQSCEVISEPHLSTSIAHNSRETVWTLYPNPSNGTMNIAMEARLSPGAFYSVFDIAGRSVANGWMPMHGLLQLDLQNLEAGTYLFQAARDGKALAPASRFTIVK